MGFAATSPSPDDEDDEALLRTDSGEQDDQDEQDEDQEEISDEAQDESKKAEVAEKRRKKLRLARLRKKAKQRGYELTGNSEVAGVLFLEIVKITDLPPERNGMSTILRMPNLSLNIHGSDADFFRYGSIRCHISGKEDLQDKGNQPQPQSGL